MKKIFSLIFACVLVAFILSGCTSNQPTFDENGDWVWIPANGVTQEDVEKKVDLENYIKRSRSTEIVTVVDAEGRQIIQNNNKELLFYLVNNTRFAMNCYVYGSDGKLLRKIWVDKYDTFPAWFLRDKNQQLRIRWEMEMMPEKFQDEVEPFFNNAADCHYKSPSHGYSTCHID